MTTPAIPSVRPSSPLVSPQPTHPEKANEPPPEEEAQFVDYHHPGYYLWVTGLVLCTLLVIPIGIFLSPLLRLDVFFVKPILEALEIPTTSGFERYDDVEQRIKHKFGEECIGTSQQQSIPKLYAPQALNVVNLKASSLVYCVVDFRDFFKLKIDSPALAYISYNFCHRVIYNAFEISYKGTLEPKTSWDFEFKFGAAAGLQPWANSMKDRQILGIGFHDSTRDQGIFADMSANPYLQGNAAANILKFCISQQIAGYALNVDSRSDSCIKSQNIRNGLVKLLTELHTIIKRKESTIKCPGIVIFYNLDISTTSGQSDVVSDIKSLENFQHITNIILATHFTVLRYDKSKTQLSDCPGSLSPNILHDFHQYLTDNHKKEDFNTKIMISFSPTSEKPKTTFPNSLCMKYTTQNACEKDQNERYIMTKKDDQSPSFNPCSYLNDQGTTSTTGAHSNNLVQKRSRSSIEAGRLIK